MAEEKWFAPLPRWIAKNCIDCGGMSKSCDHLSLRKSLAELIGEKSSPGALVGRWNLEVPPGTVVNYRSVKDGPVTKTALTTGQAYVMSGHTAVVHLEGVAGCVALDHCEPLPAAEHASKQQEFDQTALPIALHRIEVLEAAIRKHRDQRLDDRSWMDDELYEVLPE